MAGDTTTGTEIQATGTTIDISPNYPRITTDYYITKSVGVTPTGSTSPSSTKTYVNVIVTLTEIEINDFSTVWDNIKSNITSNITAITT